MPNATRRGGVDPLPNAVRSGSRPRRAAGVAACLLALAAVPAAAVSVIVPDDAPTIQQAIDSGAAEVLVRPGVYPETLVIARVIDLKGLVPYGTSPDSLPVVGGLVFADFVGEQIHSKYIRVWSLRFLTPVRNQFTWSPFWNPLYIEIAGCALDDGLWDADYVASGQIEYDLRRCRINGPMRARIPQRVGLEDCTVRAPIDLPRGFDNVTISRCDFKGPGAFAIHILDGECHIFNNTFEGFETPIRLGSWARAYVGGNSFVGPGTVPVQIGDDGELSFDRNRVTRFEFGILVPGAWGDLQATSNIIEDCGTAIRADVRYANVRNNEVRSCEAGVILNVQDGVRVTENAVLSCSGDGIVVDAGYATVEGNVVGQCLGAGFRLTTSRAYANDSGCRANTSYRNGGAGIVVSMPDANAHWIVQRNIAFENGRSGVEVSGAGTIQLGCNDWFGNVAGAVSGVEPATTDLALDPLFCDVAQGDVHLSALSPLLSVAGCGQIGALGQGCDAPIISRLTTFAAASTIEGIEVRWQVADAAPGFVAWLERAEAADGPWTTVECERASDGDVTVELDRTTAPARSYWYRLVATDRGLTRALGESVRVETPAPTRFALLGTGPNPSPGAVEATFQLAQAAEITVEVFDAQGRRVATLARGSWPAGIHRAAMTGARPASGIYLVRFRHPSGEDLRRIAIVR